MKIVPAGVGLSDSLAWINLPWKGDMDYLDSDPPVYSSSGWTSSGQVVLWIGQMRNGWLTCMQAVSKMNRR
jgi:hypothetical protein